MKNVAILAVLALELAVCSCGYYPPRNSITTTTTGNWEAQLLGGTGPTSQLNFVTSFNFTSFTGEGGQPLDITGFGFFNGGECFQIGEFAESEEGSATLNTSTAGQVTGTMTYVVTSVTNGNVLTLSTADAAHGGGVSGTSNGTTTTTGTLSNGVVWGTWTLKSPDPKSPCNIPQSAGNTFIMCQGTNTCTVP
jgi:hypothetical protein